MGDSISFNKQKLQAVALGFSGVSSESATPLHEISTNLEKVANPGNWSGPIADNAKSDLKVAMAAVEDIEKNMNEINKLLSEAANNFEGINY